MKYKTIILQLTHKKHGVLPLSTVGQCLVVWFMVFKATFNNISVILLEETRELGENHRSVASHWQTLGHNVVHLAIHKVNCDNFMEINYEK